MDYIIDAKNRPLGRVASEAAVVLQGKRSASYAPNRMSNEKVIVKNVDKMVVTGDKLTAKRYYRHTGYMGHLKSLSLEQSLAKNPERVIREAVRNMLPKNATNKRHLRRLLFEK